MIKHGNLSPRPSAAAAAAAPANRSSTLPPAALHASPNPTTTLFEMISREDHRRRPVATRRRLSVQDRIARSVSESAAIFGPDDVDVSVTSPGGSRVSFVAHRRVLSRRSRFFAANLGAAAAAAGSSRLAVEICDCDDVEVYAEVVAMMYLRDLKRRLAGEEVATVLEFLKVSAAIMFDDGVLSCLEFLDASPWPEEEEDKVVSAIVELQLHEPVSSIMQRVSFEPSVNSAAAESILVELLASVLRAKDEKARRALKAQLCRLLREKDQQGDVSSETLYHLCHNCLDSLKASLMAAANAREGGQEEDREALMAAIAREADNVHWLLEILISKNAAEEFVSLWAGQSELAGLHAGIPALYCHEISGVTARLCVAIGGGAVLASREARSSLLRTWLEALYEDFGWMKRASRSFDKKSVEDGLCQTILTLPMAQQQAVLMKWLDYFLSRGGDCPDLQRAFEVWWKRVFIRKHVAGQGGHSQLQVAACNYYPSNPT